MGVDGRMFEGLFATLILLGVCVGLGIAALIWFLFWLFGHLDITWIS